MRDMRPYHFIFSLLINGACFDMEWPDFCGICKRNFLGTASEKKLAVLFSVGMFAKK